MNLDWSDALDGVDWHELSELYRLAPLGIKPPEHLKKVYGHSLYRCFVRDGGRLVGAGRALADGGDCAYLCDIAVMPSHQGTRLGLQIVERLVALARGYRKIILYAVPGKEGFYRKAGFRRMTTAMAIFDDQAQAFERGYLRED
jgi:GNAT superfamily N-acetyltransferase